MIEYDAKQGIFIAHERNGVKYDRVTFTIDDLIEAILEMPVGLQDEIQEAIVEGERAPDDQEYMIVPAVMW